MPEDILNKLTIVIVSLNRQEYLKRLIKFWSNYNVNILIIDGSINKLKDDFSNFKNLTYVHSQKSRFERYLASIDFVKTEFVIFASDDEFYLPSALRSCINFLLSNPSYSSCGGRAVGFGTKEKKLFGIRQYAGLKDFCLDQNSAADRIFKHFSSYTPAHFYSVKHSAKWKKICSNIYKKKHSFHASHEYQMEFLTMVSGKSKIISELMWMRNNEVPRVNKERETSIEKWWYDKKFEKDKISFLQRMKKACDELSINQNSGLKENSISELFEVLIKKFVEYNNKNLFRKILQLFPYKIEIKLLKLVKKCYKITTIKEKSLGDEINILKAEGVLINLEELKKIISILENPKNNVS